MTRYILGLILVAAVGFGAGRLTAKHSLQSPTNSTPRSAQAQSNDAELTARQAVVNAAPVLQSARTQRDALRTQLDDTDFRALVRLADDAQVLASPAQRKVAIKTIVERMTELDPAAALDYANQLTDGFARRTARTAVIASVAQTDAQLALTMINGIPESAVKQSLFGTAIRAMALEDPIRALQVGRTLPGHEASWANHVYAQWASYDPEAALAHSATLSNQNMGDAARWTTLHSWLQTDPDAAVSWFENGYSTLRPRDRDRLMSMFAKSSPQTSERLAALMPPHMRGQLLLNGVMAAAQSDPAAAARQFEQLDAQDRQQISASVVAQRWAKTDRQAAMDWAAGLNAKDRTSAELGILSQWLQDDGDAALAYVDSLDDAQKKDMIDVVAQELSETDPQKAVDWLQRQPAGNVTRETIWNVSVQLSERDPAAAVAMFAQTQNQEWGPQPLQWSMRSLARQDPEQAKQWIDRMPTAEMRGTATQAVATGLMNSDPDAALAWSQTLDGTMRDRAMAGVINGIRDNPQRQYDMAHNIQDQALRAESVRIAIFAMARRDTALARQWLQASSLDDFQREELRRYLENL